jgi:CRISPR-associated protein Csm1
MTDAEMDLCLAALLHDAGKVSQRFGGDYRQKHAAMSEDFVRSLADYLGEERARRVATLAGAHHDTPINRQQKLLHVADKLAAMERQSELRERLNSDEAALVSVASRVEFRAERKEDCYHPLKPLDEELSALFPSSDSRVQAGAYQQLWQDFVQEVRALPPFHPMHLHTLLSLIRKYWTFVPSATPWESGPIRTVPDVSLYDHTKVVTAIAACLMKLDAQSLPDERLDRLISLLRQFAQEGVLDVVEQAERGRAPLARFVRIDIGGIQSFIFRIARPEADTGGVARRLRGRSFFVAMLAHALAEQLVRVCDVTPANILFCGGGTIDLLLPATQEAANVAQQTLQSVRRYLLDISGGLLSLQAAVIDLWAHDFGSFGDVYIRVAERLTEEKTRRSWSLIQEMGERLFISEQAMPHLCPSCQILPSPQGSLCPECQMHQRIGAKLPGTHSLAFVWDLAQAHDAALTFPPLNMQVRLLNAQERQQLLQRPPAGDVLIVRLNNPDEFISPGAEDAAIGFRFQFVANRVPTYQRDLIPFEPMAELGEGAARLGVLKMDVDYLGAVFGMGVDPPTISRLATLSSAFEAFFGGWLNHLCLQVSEQWAQSLPSQPKVDAHSGVFYTLYAGGDDVFVIGPWEATIRLAQAVRADFCRFVVDNPNLTLSGAVVCVKPKFPVPRFADLAEEDLARAKRGTGTDPLQRGDHVCLFDTVVSWQQAQELVQFAQDLYLAVEQKQVSKGFVYFLLRLHEEFFHDPQQPNLQWIPRFHYQLARRVPPEVVQKLRLLERIPRAMPYIRIPVSIVSLKMRED